MNSPEHHPFAQELLLPEHTTMTLEAFIESELEGYEYVKGEVVQMSPTSVEHGDISTNLVVPLGVHVRENQLGRVYTSDTGFRVGTHVLVPDIAFVSTERLPEDRSKGFPVPPDLAVEVVSPSDKQSRVSEKVLAYLEAGTRLVWVVNPVLQTVAVYRPGKDFTLLTDVDTLTGEDVVRGFSYEVSLLFE